MGKNIKIMDDNEKLIHFATGKVTTAIIQQLVGTTLVVSHVGKLRGMIVKGANGYKFNTKKEARENAVIFRDSCIKQAKDNGLI